MSSKVGYLALGYWIDKGYPSFEHSKLTSPYTFALTSPGPVDRAVRYPVPVTFYQDIQQEEFWDVGVRTFGFPLLHYRSVGEGVQLKFNYHYNWISRKFQWSFAGTPVRVSGTQPFQDSPDTLQDKLSKLETMVASTPYQRAAINLGQEILRSSQEVDTFWDNFNKQEARVKDVFFQICQPVINVGDRFYYMTNIARLISEATCFHHNMCLSVLYSDQATTIVDKEKRHRLLTWNKGCRQFVTEFLSFCTPDMHHDIMETLEHTLLQLETCRMKLFSPFVGPHEADDSQEFANVVLASQNSIMRRDICDDILANPRSSLFGVCCAEMLICGLDNHVPEGWEQRRDLLNKHMETFSKLRSEDVEHWVDSLRDWESFAAQMRDLVVQSHQGV